MTFQETIRIPAARRQLAAIRLFIEQQAQKTPASPPEIQDLIQAVDEAATNIIVHGYQDGPGQIEIQFHHHPGRITVLLRDRAPLFDPTTVPEPDLTLPLFERPAGGLGVFMIRRCVDEFAHQPRPEGGNELRMVKYLKDNGDLK